MVKRYKIKIYGLVQGVFFRVSAKEKAQGLGLTGFVRNESDSSVYIEAQGDEEQLNEFLDWCYNGPSGARVTHIKQEEIIEFTPFQTFKILYPANV